MSDISMCGGFNGSCPKRKTCYRYLAEEEKMYQSYLIPRVINGKCFDYWKVKVKKAVKK